MLYRCCAIISAMTKRYAWVAIALVTMVMPGCGDAPKPAPPAAAPAPAPPPEPRVKVYVTNEASGDLTVIKPNDKEMELVATYKVSDGETYAHPIVAGNRIYIKDQNNVMMYTV